VKEGTSWWETDVAFANVGDWKSRMHSGGFGGLGVVARVLYRGRHLFICEHTENLQSNQ
jgi:hypothetical protein